MTLDSDLSFCDPRNETQQIDRMNTPTNECDRIALDHLISVQPLFIGGTWWRYPWGAGLSGSLEDPWWPLGGPLVDPWQTVRGPLSATCGLKGIPVMDPWRTLGGRLIGLLVVTVVGPLVDPWWILGDPRVDPWWTTGGHLADPCRTLGGP